MNITRRSLAFGGMGLLASAAATRSALAQDSFLGVGQGLEDFWLASDAYIFGYPLVTMEMTRRIITNVAEPVGTRGPMGQIIKLRLRGRVARHGEQHVAGHRGGRCSAGDFVANLPADVPALTAAFHKAIRDEQQRCGSVATVIPR